MAPIVKENMAQIQSTCKKYGVKSLYLFGSAATGKYNQNSDLDFVVDYYRNEEGLPLQPFDYFQFLFSLEEITRSKIDLVVMDAIRNKIFKNKVDQEKILLYAG